MKKSMIILALLPFLAVGLEVTPAFLLVRSEKKSPVTDLSVRLLDKYLAEILGRKLRIINEGQWDKKSPAIVVGNTDYARNAGIKSDKLGSETYVLKSVGNNVIVSGGRKGTYYAALELLEAAGCRVLGMGCRITPKGASVKLPDQLDLVKTPAMITRRMYIGCGNTEFFNWNKQNLEVAGVMANVMIGRAHSFDELSRNFPADKPELFALNSAGKRLRGAGGQLCLSNPETRRLIKQNLQKVIAKSEAAARKNNFFLPEFYRVTPNDTGRGCCCAKCQEKIRQYGANSGLLLEFINDIAAEFPHLNFVTFAYRFNRDAPKKGAISARDNVFIEIALQSIEFGDGETRSTMQPWSAPVNKQAREQFLKWKDVCKNILVWDYSKLYLQRQCVPYTSVHILSENMQFYAENGIKGYFSENELGTWNGALSTHAFQELEYYLIARLSVDPQLDCEKLIDEYFKLYYQQSAPFMRQYFDLLTAAVKKYPPVETKPFAEWKYLTTDFFKQSYGFLDQALAAAGNDKPLQERIQFEIVSLNSALLALWPQLDKSKFKFSRKDVEQRLQKASLAIYSKYFPRCSRRREDQRLSALIPPEKLAGILAEVGLADAQILSFAPAPLFDDPDSAMGRSCQLRERANHSKAPIFGVYDRILRKYYIKDLKITDYPQDEKFHLYYIGRCANLTGHAYVFAHSSWAMQYQLTPIFSNFMSKSAMDVYVSAKFQGPAYVKGSDKKNCFAVDYILFAPAKDSPRKTGLVK